jgi:branched-chain amino acid transport system substrate-binding protein
MELDRSKPPIAGRRTVAASLCGLAVLIAGIVAGPARAADQPYDINVVLPLSGNAAFVGEGGKQAFELVGGLINRDGGINGHPVQFNYLDDQSSPQVAVQHTTQVVADHPAVLFGSMITAMCNAMAPLVRDGPVMYCFSSGIHPEKGGYNSYVYSSTVSSWDVIETLVRYFHNIGWNRLAVVVTTDGSGQDGEQAIDNALTKPDLRDVKIVERVHFNPTDVSIAAQVERIRTAQPQAVIAWTTGTPMGTVLKGFAQAGLDIPIAPSTGNLNYVFMRQYAAVLPKELYFSSQLGTARGEGLKLDPRIAAAKQKFFDAFAGIGKIPDNAGEVVWDATLITVDALRHIGVNATAAQLRDYIAHLQGFAGVTGIYDFPAIPQRGLSAAFPVITRWYPERTSFEAVSQPGGEPIRR